MIALLHKTPWAEVVHLRPFERAEEIFNLAQPGDTLHKIEDALATGERQDALMQALREQLAKGECKKI